MLLVAEMDSAAAAATAQINPVEGGKAREQRARIWLSALPFLLGCYQTVPPTFGVGLPESIEAVPRVRVPTQVTLVCSKLTLKSTQADTTGFCYVFSSIRQFRGLVFIV